MEERNRVFRKKLCYESVALLCGLQRLSNLLTPTYTPLNGLAKIEYGRTGKESMGYGGKKPSFQEKTLLRVSRSPLRLAKALQSFNPDVYTLNGSAKIEYGRTGKESRCLN